MGEGISEGDDEEPQAIHCPLNSSNELEDQPVGSDVEEEENPMDEKECPTSTENPTTYTATVSGWVSKPPACLIEEIGEAVLSVVEQNYYFALGELLEENEYGCIGMGIGSEIDNTNKLKVLGFNEAMASPNKDDWQALADQEYEMMLKNGVWEVVDRNNIPEGADIIHSMWAMQKKANGDY